MKNLQAYIKVIVVIVLSFNSIASFAQTPTDSLPPDPAAMSVYNVQNLSFGAFSQAGTGGTVVISNTGTRSVTGSVTALNLGVSYFNSIFEVQTPSGSIISITNGPDVTLTGSNGGSMSLVLGTTNPASPFNTTAVPPARTQIKLGGTLTVGNTASSPPGNYSGTFYITFNLQ